MKKRRLTLEAGGSSSTEVKTVGECSGIKEKSNMEYEEVIINSIYPEQKVKIGIELFDDSWQELYKFLKTHQDNFAWTTKDMHGIDRRVAKHKLKIDPTFIPVQQRPRQFKEDKEKAMKEEVKKLLDARFIEEVSYPTWLANVVMVKKANGKWRMCVDFTDLNKACTKDCYFTTPDRSTYGCDSGVSNSKFFMHSLDIIRLTCEQRITFIPHFELPEDSTAIRSCRSVLKTLEQLMKG